ncbi:MAG: hypothetical protein Q7T25_03755 [Sideroxyarcus sp.]|nr:hypothetical protein [Sideroxyarcus sp.]
MRRLVVASILVASTSIVFAQGVSVQRSSNPLGVQIQGDTMVNANAQNVNAVAAGEGNSAKNATGAIKGGTQIQGNTRINANARNVNSVAVGKGNAAANDVGSIGGR